MTISKTSVNGVLAFLIAMGGTLLALHSPLVNPKLTAGITMALALARCAVGFTQGDADRLPAESPGNPTGEAKPAHPVADDPAVK